ncbi:cobalamin B12-binding domain-containing protein [Leadbettera azotonutricia]|uniref:Methionine synthase n=1 Tax=Leadbettera azotonutricia (strain ATCC BAA-888 / DSM 13862 / ZAS-9) TaxID=545695 RepID=F5YE01_LEAAZ|nr:cobalamin-dependent protein [Leadbettera azotonutricia]AEF83279.1 methionine synthase [Leadbettera azotonutricia ZAS-9]
MINLHEIASSLKNCKSGETSSMVAMAVEENCSIECIIREGLYPGIMAAEKQYRDKEILIPDILAAERALNQSIKILRSSMQNEDNSQYGKVVTGTVKGDIREWEKNLISVLIQSMGITVIDLGTSVPIESFINAAMDEEARIIACSTALTTHLPQMKHLVTALNAANLKERIKTLFSGGPVTQLLCRGIGADFYAPDAISIAEIAVDYCRKELNFSEMQAV